MTDNDIIKALECCSCLENVCDDCPLPNTLKDDCKCGEFLSTLALELINRQKAEIERYEKEHNEKFNKWKILDDRTKERYAELYEEAKEILKAEARAEAITEFAERLKEKAFFVGGYIDSTVKVDDIDQIAKEMKGEQ